LFQAIKRACGPDFLIDAQVSGEEPAGGFTIKDIVEYAKIWEGTLDILQLRAVDGDVAHPSGLNSKKEAPITLAYAKAIRDAGVKIVTAPVGGFQDPELNNRFIAEGKADMIAMARAYICDSDYGRKIYDGRGEDVVPCIRCNDCHGLGMNGPWHSWCSVNPEIGIAHRMQRMIEQAGVTRKVAVIGGGPAGMKAAITAAERGHKVNLYERNDFLGGQIKYADYSDFKWPLKDFKNYLIRQMDKLGVEVRLKTIATPEMIKAGKFDAVVAATGAAPLIPDIPGASGSNVRAPIFVYGGEKNLGKNIVIIGGDQIGTETGIHLAKLGHNVTVLTTERQLATDANQIHFLSQLQAAYEALKNFSFITEATVKSISSSSVTYVDAKRSEKTIPAESVVIYAGRTPRREEAMTFFGAAGRYFAVGDCNSPGIVRKHGDGNVANAMRTAFAAASQI
jgi:NADPH-dependent 2,4-dienoyl-CoA reductase/sulfur reductase-like enzyme